MGSGLGLGQATWWGRTGAMMIWVRMSCAVPPVVSLWVGHFWVNNFKPEESRFTQDIRKKFFTKTMVRYWNRLPREVVYVPSLEVSKVMTDSDQPDLVQVVPAQSTEFG